MPDDRAQELEAHLTRLLQLIDSKPPANDPESLGQAEVDVSDLATNAPQGSDMKRLAAELITDLGDWYGGRHAAAASGAIRATQEKLKERIQALYSAALDRR